MLQPVMPGRLWGSPTWVCSVSVFCSDFAPSLKALPRGCTILFTGDFWSPKSLLLAGDASLIRLRMQASAFGASSGMRAGAAHIYSTGGEESGGKGHPCFRATTSRGLCLSHL